MAIINGYSELVCLLDRSRAACGFFGLFFSISVPKYDFILCVVGGVFLFCFFFEKERCASLLMINFTHGHEMIKNILTTQCRSKHHM